jgi:2-oxoglutarate ferredoxin oxidoreductase subunit gamma
MKAGLVFAGHGGQGILELANNVAYYHLLKGRHVAVTPSYGPESRGGKVKCYVIWSEEDIDSPIVEEPDTLVVMNIPSMDYVPMLKHGGDLLVNTSLVKSIPEGGDLRVVGVPATEIASGLAAFGPEGGRDTSISANSVMFGAYVALSGASLEAEMAELREVFDHSLTDRKAAYIALNLKAVEEGYMFIKRGVREVVAR